MGFFIVAGIVLIWLTFGYFSVRLTDEDIGIDGWGDVAMCLVFGPVGWFLGGISVTIDEWLSAHFLSNFAPIIFLRNKLNSTNGKALYERIFRL